MTVRPGKPGRAGRMRRKSSENFALDWLLNGQVPGDRVMVAGEAKTMASTRSAHTAGLRVAYLSPRSPSQTYIIRRVVGKNGRLKQTASRRAMVSDHGLIWGRCEGGSRIAFPLT